MIVLIILLKNGSVADHSCCILNKVSDQARRYAGTELKSSKLWVGGIMRAVAKKKKRKQLMSLTNKQEETL